MAFDSLLPPSSPFNRRVTPRATAGRESRDGAEPAARDIAAFAALISQTRDAFEKIDAPTEDEFDEAKFELIEASWAELARVVLVTPAPTMEGAFAKIRLGLLVDPDGEKSGECEDVCELVAYVKSAMLDIGRLSGPNPHASIEEHRKRVRADFNEMISDPSYDPESFLSYARSLWSSNDAPHAKAAKR